MNLQWILLALFLIAIVRNVAKALRNPMLKNFLRLLSILVAFIITFILQICGVFQNIAGKVVGSLELAAMVPEFEGAINCGDDLYDTLTKRKIGIVTYSKINEEDSGIRYEICLKDAKPPRGMYLRNKNIWFEVESVCKDKDFPI